MDKSNYEELLVQLTNKVEYLQDKPNETPTSTLNVLWFTASGQQKTVEDVKDVQFDMLPVLSVDQLEVLKKLVSQRINNTPLAYVIGIEKFMGIVLKADKRALIPRKETELLGNKALEIIKDKDSPLVIDVCCGSGNLGLSIAYYHKKAKVFASDLTTDAVELTRENTEYLGLQNRVKVKQGDFLKEFEHDQFFGLVDLIVCNPPYISSAKVRKMHVEIADNEPTEAFDGGMMGIKIIQKLISESYLFLKKGGSVAFEVGAGQGDFIMQLMSKSDKYNDICSVKDDNGIVRVIYAKKSYL